MGTVPPVGRLRPTGCGPVWSYPRRWARKSPAFRPAHAQIDAAQHDLDPKDLVRLLHLDHRDVGFAQPRRLLRHQRRAAAPSAAVADRGTPFRRFRRLHTPVQPRQRVDEFVTVHRLAVDCGSSRRRRAPHQRPGHQRTRPAPRPPRSGRQENDAGSPAEVPLPPVVDAGALTTPLPAAGRPLRLMGTAWFAATFCAERLK